MFMRSERLFLRPGWPEDWEEVLARISDGSVARNLTRTPWPYAPDDARAFAAKPQDKRLPHFLITLPTLAEPARVIGCIALGQHENDVVLGYWIAREHWGQGYASEAGRAILQLAKVLGHRRIVANHFADNPASGQVLRKLGFCPTGRIAPRYSMARGELAQAIEYTAMLGEPCDCDDDPPMKRAA